jgi:hypothetical protein
MNPMETEDFRCRVLRYVLERKCPSGGFCFYRLDEPNGSDTWHALSILDLLEVKFEDSATVAYLKGMQRPDVGNESNNAAWYGVKGLALLGATPSRDPGSYVMHNLEHYRFDAARLPVEVISLFKRTSCLVDLYAALDLEADGPLRDSMVEFILGFRNDDGGFGYPDSTLLDTARALSMLQCLQYPLADLGAGAFIRRCEVPFYGFTDIPRTTLSFLEYVHAGVLASYLVARCPTYRDSCEAYILNCGRARRILADSAGGIATLENTWHGVHALTMLSSWME